MQSVLILIYAIIWASTLRNLCLKSLEPVHCTIRSRSQVSELEYIWKSSRYMRKNNEGDIGTLTLLFLFTPCCHEVISYSLYNDAMLCHRPRGNEIRKLQPEISETMGQNNHPALHVSHLRHSITVTKSKHLCFSLFLVDLPLILMSMLYVFEWFLLQLQEYRTHLWCCKFGTPLTYTNYVILCSFSHHPPLPHLMWHIFITGSIELLRNMNTP